MKITNKFKKILKKILQKNTKNTTNLNKQKAELQLSSRNTTKVASFDCFVIIVGNANNLKSLSSI